MRWESLSTSHRAASEPATLPLALPGAVTRTFDTPGFAGMTFYEIQARSIINRVPGASRVPFEWTVNPYRGCGHACAYCLAGDTPVLMADGRTRPIAELRVGDAIYGTVREGKYRRYAITSVLAHWSTVKPALRITLEDGTTLVASGDHRFLTERGWKYVTGAMGGLGQRPYLTTSNKLMGVGAFARAPEPDPDYRRGYLCGIARGGANLASFPDDERQRFRLALVDGEALGRAERYLASFGVPTARYLHQAASVGRREIFAIRATGTVAVRTVRRLLDWPLEVVGDDGEPTASTGWPKGYLAGIFDASGSHAGSGLRIAASDPEVYQRVTAALDRCGFSHVRQHRRRADGVQVVRLAGGLGERLRFLHTVDPAVTRKRSIAGAALKSAARLGVVAVEELAGEHTLYDITTGTGDFIANGVVSHNCFARHTHTYLDLDAGHDFDSKVIVKVNAGQLLRRELAAPRWRGGRIAMGTNVDVYQRAEGRYRLMEQIIAALRDFANPFSILTKSTLILRDLELLRAAAAVTSVGLSFSVGFVDEPLWRAVESGAPSPRRRLDAVRTLTDAGFRVGVLMAPILPGLTDTDESIEVTVSAIAASGAVSLTPLALHLRPGAREWYAGWLSREHPELVAHYRALYRGGSYLPSTYQRELAARVRQAARRYGLAPSDTGRATGEPPDGGSPGALDRPVGDPPNGSPREGWSSGPGPPGRSSGESPGRSSDAGLGRPSEAGPGRSSGSGRPGWRPEPPGPAAPVQLTLL